MVPALRIELLQTLLRIYLIPEVILWSLHLLRVLSSLVAELLLNELHLENVMQLNLLLNTLNILKILQLLLNLAGLSH